LDAYLMRRFCNWFSFWSSW